jgi:hypothetical protein
MVVVVRLPSNICQLGVPGRVYTLSIVQPLLGFGYSFGYFGVIFPPARITKW